MSWAGPCKKALGQKIQRWCVSCISGLNWWWKMVACIREFIWVNRSSSSWRSQEPTISRCWRLFMITRANWFRTMVQVSCCWPGSVEDIRQEFRDCQNCVCVRGGSNRTPLVQTNPPQPMQFVFIIYMLCYNFLGVIGMS